MTIQIVSNKGVAAYRGKRSSDAIRHALTSRRGRSPERWAYLRINGRRVNDDAIAYHLPLRDMSPAESAMSLQAAYKQAEKLERLPRGIHHPISVREANLNILRRAQDIYWTKRASEKVAA